MVSAEKIAPLNGIEYYLSLIKDEWDLNKDKYKTCISVNLHTAQGRYYYPYFVDIMFGEVERLT